MTSRKLRALAFTWLNTGILEAVLYVCLFLGAGGRGPLGARLGPRDNTISVYATSGSKPPADVGPPWELQRGEPNTQQVWVLLFMTLVFVRSVLLTVRIARESGRTELGA